MDVVIYSIQKDVYQVSVNNPVRAFWNNAQQVPRPTSSNRLLNSEYVGWHTFYPRPHNIQ